MGLFSKAREKASEKLFTEVVGETVQKGIRESGEVIAKKFEHLSGDIAKDIATKFVGKELTTAVMLEVKKDLSEILENRILDAASKGLTGNALKIAQTEAKDLAGKLSGQLTEQLAAAADKGIPVEKFFQSQAFRDSFSSMLTHGSERVKDMAINGGKTTLKWGGVSLAGYGALKAGQEVANRNSGDGTDAPPDAAGDAGKEPPKSWLAEKWEQGKQALGIGGTPEKPNNFSIGGGLIAAAIAAVIGFFTGGPMTAAVLGLAAGGIGLVVGNSVIESMNKPAPTTPAAPPAPPAQQGQGTAPAPVVEVVPEAAKQVVQAAASAPAPATATTANPTAVLTDVSPDDKLPAALPSDVPAKPVNAPKAASQAP